MFESLKQWLSAGHESHFKHPEEAKLHVALASLLYHIMDADHRSTDRERKLFEKILQEEFSLSREQIYSLYEYVRLKNSDLKSDLDTVSHYLKETPTVRMDFMNNLNRLIGVDGVQTAELEIFFQAMVKIFPEYSENFKYTVSYPGSFTGT